MKALGYAAALLLAALAALALRWAAEHYTDAPGPEPVYDDPRLSFHRAAHLARDAVRRYRALPPYERRAVNDALAASLADLDAWSESLAAANFVCLGERHEAAVRAFLGAHVLPRLDYRVLMLETGTGTLRRLVQAWRVGETATLLDAPLDAVLDDALTRRPPPRLVAIDEPPAKPGTATSTQLTREQRLVRAVARHWHPGRRHVVVFGALHCRDLPGWMYREVTNAHPHIAESGMHGSVMLARYQEPGAQILFYLLEEIGFHSAVFAVNDVRRFPRQVQDWLPPTADALAGYRSAVLFDERALGLRPEPAP